MVSSSYNYSTTQNYYSTPQNTQTEDPVETAFSLGQVYSNLEPGSAEAQQIEQRVVSLDQMFTTATPGAGEDSPISAAFSLGITAANLEPESIEAQQINQRVELLSDEQSSSQATTPTALGGGAIAGLTQAVVGLLGAIIKSLVNG